MVDRRTWIVASVGALLALAASGCKHKESEAAAAAEAAGGGRPPAAVSVAQVVTRDVPIYIDEVGRTTAPESVTIQPQVSGKVLEVHFKDGADVKKGDLLFTIDPRPFKAALAEMEGELAENRAQLKWSQDEVKRLETVRGTGAVSQQDYDKAINVANVSEAKVQGSLAKVETAKVDVDYCSIYSPINGRAGERMVDPGNVVTGGGTSTGTQMLVIQSFDPIYADFTVTENVLGTVRKFMAAGALEATDPVNRLTVLVDVPGDAQQVAGVLSGSRVATTGPTTASSPSAASTQPMSPDRPVVMGGSGAGPRTGTLTFLDNRVQESTGTVKVRATLANKDRYFWPGQFVRVRLVLTTKKDAPLIPELAQQIGQQGPYVYVVKQDSTAEMRAIKPGQRQPGGMLVVNDGVRAGEQVITAGHMGVVPGAKVSVQQPTTQPGQPQDAKQQQAKTDKADGGGEGASKS